MQKQNFYAIDSISAVAVAIQLLQNNCTFLNAMLANVTGTYSEFRKRLEEFGIKVPDNFCEIAEFTPATISLVLRFVNFTGYTGEISFDPFTLLRLQKTFYLYDLYNNSFTGVGKYSINSQELNSSAIIFPDGQEPLSCKLSAI